MTAPETTIFANDFFADRLRQKTCKDVVLWDEYDERPMQEVLGVQLAAAGRCEEALPQLERALSISPHHWHLAVAAARCARDPRLAAELREQALRTEPHMGLR